MTNSESIFSFKEITIFDQMLIECILKKDKKNVGQIIWNNFEKRYMLFGIMTKEMLLEIAAEIESLEAKPFNEINKENTKELFQTDVKSALSKTFVLYSPLLNGYLNKDCFNWSRHGHSENFNMEVLKSPNAFLKVGDPKILTKVYLSGNTYSDSLKEALGKLTVNEKIDENGSYVWPVDIELVPFALLIEDHLSLLDL